MKINWQTKKLSEICDIYQPKTISKKDMVPDGKYLVFGANGVIGKYNKYNHEDPQLLITCRGATCGSVNVSQPKSWITGNAMVIRPKNTSLDLKYLEYIFRGGLDISKVITGAAQPQITRANLEPVEIFYPEYLPEQQRIVKILDEVFKKIDLVKKNLQKNLQNSKDFFESYLNNIFINPGNDWEVIDFEDSIEKVLYTNKIQKNKFLKTGKFPIISQEKDLINGYWNIERDLFYAKRPCIVFGDHTKIVKYVNFDFVLGADGVKILQPKDIIYPKFFFYFLSSIKLKNLGYSRHYRLLKEKKVVFPKSLSEQKKVVVNLDVLSEQTKKLEEIYKKKLDNLEELKKSILKKAFGGEL